MISRRRLRGMACPKATKSLVLIIDDPDAPDPKAPQRVWVHWVVYNIPPDTKSLPENASKAGLPQGTAVGLNDFKNGLANITPQQQADAEWLYRSPDLDRNWVLVVGHLATVEVGIIGTAATTPSSKPGSWSTSST